MNPRRWCHDCGRERRIHEWSCACGGSTYVGYVPGSARPGVELGPLGGILGPLQLPAGAVALLFGRRGSGKTTVALQALAPSSRSRSSRPRPWISSSEMAPGLVRSYAQRLQLGIAGVSVPTVTEPSARGAVTGGPELAEAVDLGIPDHAQGADLVLDSLTATGADLATLRAVQRYVQRSGARAIVTAQVTKEGAPRGSSAIEHDPDLVIELLPVQDRGEARIRKNRFGPLDTLLYVLTGTGVTRPTWSGYYSIEGTAPDYRLVPWPAVGSAPYADPLREAERGKLQLPEAPLAVCAQRSGLYPSGWAAPPDLEARERFAQLAGLPTWRPAPAPAPAPQEDPE